MKNIKERFDLESITKNISENYKPVNVRLTSYEQDQEDNAIISYEELVRKSNDNKLNYDTSYTSDETDIEVKKIDLENENIDNPVAVPDRKPQVTFFSYEKEEEFLKALKQLQGTLVR